MTIFWVSGLTSLLGPAEYRSALTRRAGHGSSEDGPLQKWGENGPVRETIYNLFLFVEDGIITGLGVTSRESGGSDTEKLALLQRNARDDIGTVRRFPIPSRFKVRGVADGKERIVSGLLTYERYRKLVEASEHLDVFEELFKAIGAPPDPLLCITPVVDGVPRVDGVVGFGIGPLT